MEDEKMETSKTERDWLRNISEKRTTPTEKEEKKETKPKAAKKKPAAKKDRSMVMVLVTLLAWTV